MGWTTPRTWSPGETVTATLMNAHVRDNLNVLKTSIEDDGSIEAASLSGLTAAFLTALIPEIVPIHFDVTPVGNVGAGSDLLQNFDIPAGTLTADGQAIEILMFFKTANNANAKRVDAFVGGTAVIADANLGAANQVLQIRIRAWRFSTTVLRVYASEAGGQASIRETRNDITVNYAAAINLHGQAVTATSTDDIVQELLAVRWLKRQ
jgi:hypothetical protein